MPSAPPVKVAFLGFSEFERNSLASYFRLAAQRVPRYVHTPMLTEAERLVADADHAPSVQLVLATERQDHTVFIGARAPDGSRAWLQRPIDALQVMRHLDTLGAGAGADAGAAAAAIAGGADGGPGEDDSRRDPDPGRAPERPGGAAGPPHAEPADGAPGVTSECLPMDLPDAGPVDVPPGETAPVAAPVAPTGPRTIEIAMATRAVAPPAAAQEAPGAPPSAVAGGLPPGRRVAPPPPRALLVDDSEVALRYLQQRLQPWGVQADTAADSGAALELLARNSYQLVFVDVELGEASELDGLALCREIKQSEAAVEAAVVLVSAHHSELDRVRGSLAGCDAYLGKPLDEAQLRRLLLRHGCREPVVAAAAPVVPG